MANIIRTVYLVKSDPEKNNNKFWKATEFADCSVFAEWGRIGDPGQNQTKNFSSQSQASSFLDKKIAEKKRDGRNGEIGYREVDIIDGVAKPTTTKPVVDANRLATIAKSQIKCSSKNKEITALIDYLTKQNIHDIVSVSGGNITYNYQEGLFQTPLGLVGSSTISQARDILSEIADQIQNHNYDSKFMDLHRSYCMLIPQDIGRKRIELSEFWDSINKVQQQNQILDGLSASLAQIASNKNDATPVPEEEKVFDTEMDVVTDKKVTKELFDYYYETRSTMHSCYHYKPVAVWKVRINSMEKTFNEHGGKMSCLVKGFHGSGTANMLSLLKSGMLVRPPKNAVIAGALFGPGIYCAPIFRDNGEIIKGAATKALGYSTGFWGGNKANRVFMFVVDMAMGKYYVPEARTYMSTKYPVNGYDSTWAYGNHSGVRNDEAIVYRSGQVNIKYLMELSPN